MRAGAAVSRHEDVRIAARDAAARALDAADLDGAGCLLVGATPEHLDEAIDLCAELRDVAGASTHIFGGATSAAFVPGDAEAEEGPALGVLALEEPGFPFSFRADDPAELRAAAQRAGPGALALVFADPAAPLQRLLGALGRDAPRAQVAGGGVVVDGGLLLDDDVTEAHAVGAFFPAAQNAHLVANAHRGHRVAVAQSHQPIGKPLLVTRSEGRSLFELDSRPAVDALAALAELPGLSGEALQFVALALSPSPGEAFREDDFVSVPLLGVDEERGSIETGVQVPEGHSVSFTLRDGMGARRTMVGALQRLAGAVPAFGVYFDCASRGTNLYGVGGLDMGLIEKSLGSFPLLSLRTSFELGPSGQGTGLHLFTGVLALGER
jgi:small ligand-binding sensory domain FIST